MTTLPQINMNAIFMSLPSALAILRQYDSEYIVEEVNRAFILLFGMERKAIIHKSFFKTINGYATNGHKDQLGQVRTAIETALLTKKDAVTDILNLTLPGQKGHKKSLYLQFKCSPVLKSNTKTGTLIIAIENVGDLLTFEEKKSNGKSEIQTREELVTKAESNKAQYESASRELDDFVYSVSHDLRAPLRRIDGFSQELLNEYADKLDETGAHYLERVRNGAQDMGQIIDDLLDLTADDERWGKTIGGDLIGAKKTYLLLRALSLSKGEARDMFERIAAGNGLNADEVPLARRRMDEAGVLNEAAAVVDRESQRALQLLDKLPAVPARSSLQWLIERMRARGH